AKLTAAFNKLPACASSCLTSINANPGNLCTQGGFSTLLSDNAATCNTKIIQSCSQSDFAAWGDLTVQIHSICGDCWIKANGGSNSGTACNFAAPAATAAPKSGAMANSAGFTAAAGIAFVMMAL
ncbi:hypothetical protein HK101_003650, partial [Irineochytrium annulatum]